MLQIRRGLSAVLFTSSLALMVSVARAEPSHIVLAGDRGAPQVAVSLERTADYVAVPMRLTGDSSRGIDRIEAVEDACNKLIRAASKNPHIDLHLGPASVSTSTRSAFGALTSGSIAEGQTRLLVVAKLGKDDSVFTVGRRIARFIGAIEFADDVTVRLGATHLAVESPEQYRADLLALIRSHVEETKEALGGQGDERIDGLAGPTRVYARDERRVALTIDYELSLEY